MNLITLNLRKTKILITKHSLYTFFVSIIFDKPLCNKCFNLLKIPIKSFYLFWSLRLSLEAKVCCKLFSLLFSPSFLFF